MVFTEKILTDTLPNCF